MKHRAETGKKLPRQVKVLGAVSLLNDSASEMIVPLMPLFVTQVLGLGPAVLGLMEGVAEAVASLLKFLSGWWSDRLRRRKPLAVAGYALACATRPLMGLVVAGWQLVALRGIDRTGKGLRAAPRDALLAESVEPSQRGRAFGFNRAMDHAGAVVGPLAALVLMSGFSLDLRTVFLLAAVPGVATVLLIALAVRETPAADPQPAGKGVAAAPQGLDRRRFWVFLLAMFMFTLGNSTDVFLVLHAHELGVPAVLAPVLWMVLHISKSVSSTPLAGLSDRFGRLPVILAGWVVYALVYGLYGAASAAWQVWPLLVVYGLYYGLTEGPSKAMTADLVPAGGRGKGFGIYHLALGVASLPASVLAGYLWQAHGPAIALWTGAAFAALAAVVLALFYPSTPSREADRTS